MKVLVCGGREYADKEFLYLYLDDFYKREPFTHLIHGDARGADHLAHGWAVMRHVQPVRVPALWDVHGPRAGAIRNKNMLELLDVKKDCVVAFPGGPGTAHMTKVAVIAGVRVVVVIQDGGRKDEPIRNDHESGREYR